jgi:hypothetical protein
MDTQRVDIRCGSNRALQPEYTEERWSEVGVVGGGPEEIGHEEK